jgi:hypothetical protein
MPNERDARLEALGTVGIATIRKEASISASRIASLLITRQRRRT